MSFLNPQKALSILGAFCVLVLVQVLCAAAETPVKIKPTIVYDARAEVTRGGEVEVVLNAIPNYGVPVAFEISQPPAHGTLSPPKAISDHSAAVTYRHDGSKAPMQDEFSFRAKTPGRAASVVSKARIRIIPPAPRIIFKPSSLDFGEAILGETRETNLTISNVGGTRATGRLLLPKGFSAPEGDGFALDEGDVAVIGLKYTPMEEGRSSGEVRTLPPLSQESLSLHGVGRPRYDLINRGPAIWEVANNSGKPIRLNFSGGVGWQLPQETVIPPHEVKVVSFHQAESEEETPTPSDDKPSLVCITDGLSSKEIPLPPPRRFIPMTVQGVTPEMLPSTPIGSSTPVVFRLHNRSEFPKLIHWSAVSQSGGGTSSTNAWELHPGEMKEIQFEWFPTIPGDALLKVIVQEGAKTRHELQWRTRVLSGVSSKQGDGGVGAPISSLLPAIMEEELTATPSAAGESKPIPLVDEIAWEIRSPWFGKQTVIVTWKSPEKSRARVVLDEMILVRADDTTAPEASDEASKLPAVKLQAIPLTGYRQITRGGRQFIEISHFSPGWHLLQLKLYAGENDVPLACSQLQVKVPPKTPWWLMWKVPLGLSVVFLLLLFLRRTRRSL